MERVIRARITMGLVGCERESTFPLPDDWDEMSEGERDDYLTEIEQDVVDAMIEVYAEVIER